MIWALLKLFFDDIVKALPYWCLREELLLFGGLVELGHLEVRIFGKL